MLDVASPRPLESVGADMPRIDATQKITGQALYTADLTLPGMLHAKVLRSNRAHARIVRIDAARARGMPGVRAVLTRDDVPAHLMAVYGYFIKDQPIVATDKVRYEGDIVAAVAADTEHAGGACARGNRRPICRSSDRGDDRGRAG